MTGVKSLRHFRPQLINDQRYTPSELADFYIGPRSYEVTSCANKSQMRYVALLKKTDRSMNSAANKQAFIEWARRVAIPMPTSPESQWSHETQSAFQRMIDGRRFVFLGEPDHFLLEKFSYRLAFIRQLFQHGWRHIGMEMGRSMGWRFDRYLETADRDFLDRSPMKEDYDYRRSFGGMYDFIERHESEFQEEIIGLNESRPAGTPRVCYFGFDFDLGSPLAAVEPILELLADHQHDDQVRDVVVRLRQLDGLETHQQLNQLEAICNLLADQRQQFIDSLGESRFRCIGSWMRTLRFSVASVNRPRYDQDQSGHRIWRAEREKMMMEHLDAQVASCLPEDKFILLSHNGHLSKDARNVYSRPQRSTFWGYRSWLRYTAYRLNEIVTRRPLDLYGGSIGSHIHRRFPGQVFAIWMLYGEGQLMGRRGPIDIRLHTDTVESLLAQVGEHFLLPLHQVDRAARAVLACANFRSASGYYGSADLTSQADALYFVREVSAVRSR